MPADRALALAGGALTFLLLVYDRRHLESGLPWTARGALALLLVGAVAALAYAFDAPRNSPSLRFVARPIAFWPALVAGVILWFLAAGLV
jgi:hypothetical protein